MDIELLIKQVKAFLRMASEVTVYDEEIKVLLRSGINVLRGNGIEVTNTPLVTDYLCTYVRTRMLRDTSQIFRDFELEREKSILNQLYFGGTDESTSNFKL